MKRTIKTTNIVSAQLGVEFYCLKALDEINTGICDGMTY